MNGRHRKPPKYQELGWLLGRVAIGGLFGGLLLVGYLMLRNLL
jgi:hypothetical protein